MSDQADPKVKRSTQKKADKAASGGQAASAPIITAEVLPAQTQPSPIAAEEPADLTIEGNIATGAYYEVLVTALEAIVAEPHFLRQDTLRGYFATAMVQHQPEYGTCRSRPQRRTPPKQLRIHFVVNFA